MISLGSSALAEPFIPSATDMAIIQSEVAGRLLDPSSALLSQVIATSETVDGAEMTWVCGSVQGKNTFGGYAQPTPFMGALLDSPGQGRAFVVISIAGPTAAERLSVLQTCMSKMEGAENLPAPQHDVADLVSQERELNSRCRGSEGADPASTVCDERNALARQLGAQGWCYGREGEAGYQADWHACSAGSIRPQ